MTNNFTHQYIYKIYGLFMFYYILIKIKLLNYDFIAYLKKKNLYYIYF